MDRRHLSSNIFDGTKKIKKKNEITKSSFQLYPIRRIVDVVVAFIFCWLKEFDEGNDDDVLAHA